MYTRFFKRFFDLLLGVIALVFLAVPMLFLAVLVKIDDIKSPAIFRQTRVGRNGSTFKILKFRSMKADTPKHLPSCQLTAEEYEKHVTGIGKFLRKTSLDEIPQVFNIIKGDMSWVGPRPVLVKEKELTQARSAAGLDSFRPGLTGWAQINGRNTLTDEEKARYDAEYVGKISFLFDIWCMISTVGIVVTKKGFLEGQTGRFDPAVDFELSEEYAIMYDRAMLDSIRIGSEEDNAEEQEALLTCAGAEK